MIKKKFDKKKWNKTVSIILVVLATLIAICSAVSFYYGDTTSAFMGICSAMITMVYVKVSQE